MTLPLLPDDELSALHFEQRAARAGFRAVAGLDEAGRGPLAGPVVAAAVILPEAFDLPGLTDSKKLSAAQRERFFDPIRTEASAYGIALSTAATIDSINILQATVRAMEQSVARLHLPPDYLLIDGITPLPIAIQQQTLKKGDSRSLSIAAASVLAKVVRDRLMVHYDRVYPGYGFAAHKGYGTKDHYAALKALGPCPLHRRSFAGVSAQGEKK